MFIYPTQTTREFKLFVTDVDKFTLWHKEIICEGLWIGQFEYEAGEVYYCKSINLTSELLKYWKEHALGLKLQWVTYEVVTYKMLVTAPKRLIQDPHSNIWSQIEILAETIDSNPVIPDPSYHVAGPERM